MFRRSLGSLEGDAMKSCSRSRRVIGVAFVMACLVTTGAIAAEPVAPPHKAKARRSARAAASVAIKVYPQLGDAGVSVETVTPATAPGESLAGGPTPNADSSTVEKGASL